MKPTEEEWFDPNQEETDEYNGRTKKRGQTHPAKKSRSGKRKKSAHKASSRRRRKKTVSKHTIFFAVAALLFILTVIRLLVWNIGKESDYDPNEHNAEFDTELLDYVQPLDPEVLKGRTDDGVTTILALGNDPLSDERGEDGLCALMEKATGATILNAAFPGSTISMKNPEFENQYPLDGVSLYWIVAALCNQNFELMDVIVPMMGSEAASAALQTLKETDMDKVDAMVLFYDLQDYKDGRIVYDENNLKNLNTCFGALSASIQLMQDTYPYIRLYLLCPTYGTYTDENGALIDADMDDLGNGTLADYINWYLEACRSNGITFIDNYYGAVSMEDTDCLTDGFHLNQKGRQKVAARFADIFKR